MKNTESGAERDIDDDMGTKVVLPTRDVRGVHRTVSPRRLGTLTRKLLYSCSVSLEY